MTNFPRLSPKSSSRTLREGGGERNQTQDNNSSNVDSSASENNDSSPRTKATTQSRPGKPGTAMLSPRISPTTRINSDSSSEQRQKQQQQRTRILTDDCEIIAYGNGAVREIYLTAQNETLRFPNGDVQHWIRNGSDDVSTSYYYNSTGVIQVQYGTHDEITRMEYHFPNGQVEEHYPDGSKVILFADGNLQCFDAAEKTT